MTKQQASGIRQSKIRNYVKKIEKSWHTALESIFAVGDLINAAKKELSQEEFNHLIGSRDAGLLPFGRRTAERLAEIARARALRRVSTLKQLPASWTTIYELKDLDREELNEAIRDGSIHPDLKREEARQFVKGLKGKSRKSGKKRTTNGSLANNKPYIAFDVPDQLSNFKSPVDILFLCEIVSQSFNNARGKYKVQVVSNPFKTSAKLTSSYERISRLIDATRELENHRRVQNGKQPLDSEQELLSLFGSNPDDNVGDAGFSLMEHIAFAYAKRQGIDAIDESQFNWFAPNRKTEPELLGSFLDDVEDQVSTIINKGSTRGAKSNLYKLRTRKKQKKSAA